MARWHFHSDTNASQVVDQLEANLIDFQIDPEDGALVVETDITDLAEEWGGYLARPAAKRSPKGR